MARPDYRVCAKRDADENDGRLVNLGVAWHTTSIDGCNPYIKVQLDAKPWGEWDGVLMLFPTEPRKE